MLRRRNPCARADRKPPRCTVAQFTRTATLGSGCVVIAWVCFVPSCLSGGGGCRGGSSSSPLCQSSRLGLATSAAACSLTVMQTCGHAKCVLHDRRSRGRRRLLAGITAPGCWLSHRSAAPLGPKKPPPSEESAAVLDVRLKALFPLLPPLASRSLYPSLLEATVNCVTSSSSTYGVTTLTIAGGFRCFFPPLPSSPC